MSLWVLPCPLRGGSQAGICDVEPKSTPKPTAWGGVCVCLGGGGGCGWAFPVVAGVGACAVRVRPHAVALRDCDTGDGGKTRARGPAAPSGSGPLAGGAGVQGGHPPAELLRGFGVSRGTPGRSLLWDGVRWGRWETVAGGGGGIASFPVPAAVGHGEDGDEDLGGLGGPCGASKGAGGGCGPVVMGARGCCSL